MQERGNLCRLAVALLPALLARAWGEPLLCTRAGGLAREHHLAEEFKEHRAVFSDHNEEACRRRGCVYRGGRCVYPNSVDGGGAAVRTVHVIHSNHFDAGYTDGVVNVLNTYFDTYFPRAIKIGAALRANQTAHNRSFPNGLRWLTQSYLVQLYLACPTDIHLGLHCPSPQAVDAMKAAIAAGDITWHAWPNNAELALTTAFSAAAGVALTHLLDDSLGVARKTVISQRDVPGMERSTISALRAAGIRAFSEGMNGRISPPNVPDVFLWQDGDASMLSLWHPRGYGVLGDYLIVPGSAHALAYVWRNDNTGPPMSAAEALADHAKISQDFPHATRIIASTLDDFVNAIWNEKGVMEALPKIQLEIGDTWIFGAASDPKKLAKFRAAQRQLETVCTQVVKAKTAEACLSQSAALRNFTGLLLKAPEHTWGSPCVDVWKLYLIWLYEFRFQTTSQSQSRFCCGL